MDLARGFPRSPRERLDGLSMFPRAVDKARASIAGTLGEYIYDCPMDRQLFSTLGVSAEQFLDAVKRSDTDDDVISRLRPLRKPLGEPERAAHNQRIDHWVPSSPEGWEHYREDLEKLAKGRTDIKNRTDLIDLEEGRLSPVVAADPVATDL